MFGYTKIKELSKTIKRTHGGRLVFILFVLTCPQTSSNIFYMNKALLILTTIGTLALTGCGAFKNNLGRTVEAFSSGNYIVTVWSGDKAVRTYEVKDGFVNSEKESDGWFFIHNGKLVRISGTVTIEQQ